MNISMPLKRASRGRRKGAKVLQELFNVQIVGKQYLKIRQKKLHHVWV